MRLFRSPTLPDHWIAEDHGALMAWPAERGGWERRDAYKGPKRGLEEVESIRARGTGWPGAGRGRVPRSGEVSRRRLLIRATDGEVDAWTGCADGKPLATWARDVLNAEVARRRR